MQTTTAPRPVMTADPALAQAAVPVGAASVLGYALTDYALSRGTRSAPAQGAGAHIATWLDNHGYTITRKQV